MHPFAILAPTWRRAPAAGIVAGALQEVEEIFRRQLRSDLPAVNELARHVERYRGKMLRPTLLLLSGLAATGREDEAALSRNHKMAAAVSEMIHMATLVHDDVLDEADTRRRGGEEHPRLQGECHALVRQKRPARRRPWGLSPAARSPGSGGRRGFASLGSHRSRRGYRARSSSGCCGQAGPG